MSTTYYKLGNKPLGTDYQFILQWVAYAEKLELQLAEAQTKIDELMLEYCSDDMSKLQTEQWGDSQVVSDEPLENDDEPEPAWIAEKAKLDAYDDGDGAYWYGNLFDKDSAEQTRIIWKDFLVWAEDNLGHGYSLACYDGRICDPVTNWAFLGYMAGRLKNEGDNND